MKSRWISVCLASPKRWVQTGPVREEKGGYGRPFLCAQQARIKKATAGVANGLYSDDRNSEDRMHRNR